MKSAASSADVRARKSQVKVVTYILKEPRRSSACQALRVNVQNAFKVGLFWKFLFLQFRIKRNERWLLQTFPEVISLIWTLLYGISCVWIPI